MVFMKVYFLPLIINVIFLGDFFSTVTYSENSLVENVSTLFAFFAFYNTLPLVGYLLYIIKRITPKTFKAIGADSCDYYQGGIERLFLVQYWYTLHFIFCRVSKKIYNLTVYKRKQLPEFSYSSLPKEISAPYLLFFWWAVLLVMAFALVLLLND
ncbi:hypothetical protein ACKC9G_14520 [Pokkaliibacter sp. CJK22405]|uniref:hypothetical protein n=1 Tax=Pokkaliibacter sp. CJK22405 TaxID=3384615 RepID=UPI00398524F3